MQLERIFFKKFSSSSAEPALPFLVVQLYTPSHGHVRTGDARSAPGTSRFERRPGPAGAEDDRGCRRGRRSRASQGRDFPGRDRKPKHRLAPPAPAPTPPRSLTSWFWLDDQHERIFLKKFSSSSTTASSPAAPGPFRGEGCVALLGESSPGRARQVMSSPTSAIFQRFSNSCTAAPGAATDPRYSGKIYDRGHSDSECGHALPEPLPQQTSILQPAAFREQHPHCLRRQFRTVLGRLR